MNILRKILFSQLLLCSIQFPFSATGQVHELNFNQYSINDGLSQNMVQAICEDRQGFMWFGTKDGLNRFDGHKFLVYRSKPGNSHWLNDNNITAIYEDKKGNLWVGTNLGGLNFFDRKREKFCVLKDVSVHENISDAKCINQIGEDENGDIWIGTYRSFFRVKIKDRKKGLQLEGNTLDGQYELHSWFKNTSGSKDAPVNRSFCLSRSGEVYFAASTGLYRSVNSVINRNIPIFKKIWDKNVSRVIEDNNGLIWFCTAFGLYCYHPLDGKTEEFHDPNFIDPVYTGITVARDNRLWFIEWEKQQKNRKYVTFLSYFDLNTHTFKKLKYNLSLDFNRIYFGGRDIIWIGTAGEGVVKYNLSAEDFHYSSDKMLDVLAKNNLELKNIFFQNWAYITVKRKGDNKLRIFNWITKNYYPLSMARELIGLSSLPGLRIDFSDILLAYVKRNGEIWTESENFKDLNLIDFNNKILKTIHTGFRMHFMFYEDQKNRLWCAYNDGQIFKINAAENGLDSFVINPKSLDLSDLQTYLGDNYGNLWIGTAQGLIKFNPESGKVKYLYKPGGLYSYNILSLLIDPVHPGTILWAGTEGGGLMMVNLISDSVSQFTTADGLPNDVVYGIMADHKNKLWLSTNLGLSEFDPGNHTFVNFSKDDGLQSNEFNRFTFGQFKNGDMWFGGLEGINLFNPGNIRRDTIPPKILFTGLKIFNKDVDFKSPGSPVSEPIEYLKSIVLPWNQNMISLEFAAFDFLSPSLVKYSWKMEGIDNDWVKATSDHIATYANLAPGKYVFRLRAANNNGFWNNDGIGFEITILPPWWRTLWAYVLYIAIFAGLIIGFIRFRLNRLRLQDALKTEQKEARRLQDMDEIKTRFFSNITHEFRTPLTLILGPIEQLLKKVTDKEQAAELSRINRNGRQLLHLINQLLDLNKLEGRSMKLELYSAEMVEFISNIVESFRSGVVLKNIKLEFKTSLINYYASCDTDKLQKILDNLLSNALKFTPEYGEILVEMRAEVRSGTHWVFIRVADTGIGISREQQSMIFERFYQADGSATRKEQGTGIGLSLVKELIDLFEGTVSLQSEPGQGSTFTVAFPVHIIETATVPELNARPEIADTMIIAQPRVSEETSGQSVEEPDKPLVLIIEDNADMRQYIRNCLKENYSIAEAENGDIGLAAAFEHIPDLVISDVMMPGKNGFEVTDILKKDERSSHIPVILLTAKTAIESRLMGLKTKADAYMAKPFNAEELLLTIQNQINLRRQLIERYSKNLKDISIEPESPQEDKFIVKLRNILEKHLDEPEFGVEGLCLEAAMSRTQLHRKIKALTGNNTTWFIKRVRLEHAFEILKTGDHSVSEVAYSVGFNTPNYFSKCFHEYYGFAPGEVKKNS